MSNQTKLTGIRTIPLEGADPWEIGWLTKAKTVENEMTQLFLHHLQNQFDSQELQ